MLMTKAGERYWRLHVELQALEPEKRDGPEGHALCEQSAALMDSLTGRDRDEIAERLRIAKGV